MNLCYGNAILSRFPISQTETVVFGNRRVGEKGFLFTEVEVGGRAAPPSSTCTCTIGSRVKRAASSSNLLLAWLQGEGSGPVAAGAGPMPPIVCGDFNNPNHTATTPPPPSLAT